MTNSNEVLTKIATNLIDSLRQMAPAYIFLGNHEIEYQKKYDENIIKLFEQVGAIVLDHENNDVIINQQIRLDVIYGYCLPKNYEIALNQERCIFGCFSKYRLLYHSDVPHTGLLDRK